MGCDRCDRCDRCVGPGTGRGSGGGRSMLINLNQRIIDDGHAGSMCVIWQRNRSEYSSARHHRQAKSGQWSDWRNAASWRVFACRQHSMAIHRHRGRMWQQLISPGCQPVAFALPVLGTPSTAVATNLQSAQLVIPSAISPSGWSSALNRSKRNLSTAFCPPSNATRRIIESMPCPYRN